MKTLFRVGQWLSMIFLSLLVLTTVVDVFLRSAFNKPIWGNSEISVYLLALSIASGFFVVNNNRGHITIDLFHGVLKRLLGKAYYGFVTGLELLGTFLFGGILALYAFEAFEEQEVSVVLEVRIDIVFAAAALLVLLSAIYIVFPIHSVKEKNDD